MKNKKIDLRFEKEIQIEFEKPNYCQNSKAASCLECSLSSYFLDCQNMPFNKKTKGGENNVHKK